MVRKLLHLLERGLGDVAELLVQYWPLLVVILLLLLMLLHLEEIPTLALVARSDSGSLAVFELALVVGTVYESVPTLDLGVAVAELDQQTVLGCGESHLQFHLGVLVALVAQSGESPHRAAAHPKLELVVQVMLIEGATLGEDFPCVERWSAQMAAAMALDESC